MSHLEQCYCVVPLDIFDILVFISGVVSFDILPFDNIWNNEMVFPIHSYFEAD